MRVTVVLTLLMAVVGPNARAQEASPFRPLDLPAPTGFRSASGHPGPAYWQQRVDYQIKAALDAARNELSGTETITYTNNSPHPLTYLWMHLEQNI